MPHNCNNCRGFRRKKIISKRISNNKKLRVIVGYPPVDSRKGVPLLSQNRQFQYFHAPTYIYPTVPAYAATLVKNYGCEVLWLDGIAEKVTYEEWLKSFKSFKPDVFMLETKSPIIKEHWRIVNDLKEKFPKTKIIMVGDHVTFNPRETLNSCNVDAIITGGDYDFLLLEIVKSITEKTMIPGGIWLRGNEKDIILDPEISTKVDDFYYSGPLILNHNLDELPFIDRDLTKWKLYAYENGNYKFTPATYMYSGRDCWWNRCTFCVWDHTLNPQGTYRRFSPQRLFDEVKHAVDNYGVKEIFDDAGTMFVGPPLKKFCELLIDSGYNKKVVFGCNMRLNALTKEYYDLMGKANFRFILFGLESANQETLDRLDKGLKVEEVETGVRLAKEAGLEPHVTIMLGYPWETEEMALNTINFSKNLFKKGYIDTMQATIVIPYPGTPLYRECLENDWLQVDPTDYEKFDMRSPVMKIPFSNDRLLELTQSLYSSFFTPRFILRKIIEIKSWADIKFIYVAAIRFFGHLVDFDATDGNKKGFSPKVFITAIKRIFSTAPKKKDN